jgi:hypothetical protein
VAASNAGVEASRPSGGSRARSRQFGREGPVLVIELSLIAAK